MKAKRILIIDDERPLLETLEMFLTEKGYAARCAMSATEGLKQCTIFDPHVIILDIRLPDMNGLEVLQELIRNGRKNIIIITAFHDMDITIKAMKFGAFDYIPKPIDVEELDRVIDKALKSSSSTRTAEAISIDPFLSFVEGKIIGKSRGMKEIFKAIGVLSENRITVLIEGETGTGKELIARAIHQNSPYKEHPFCAINCSTIVGTLLESELFGHEKGAFTGASRSKRGKFELAGQGTIFLDEIGEIPFELQSKLLRFLQEKEFERLGGEKRIQSNARVIAATNKDLEKELQKRGFREDLYYRLKVVTVELPPLRERKEDIFELTEFFIKKYNQEFGKRIKGIEEDAMKALIEYNWPGNIRHLESVIERAVLMCETSHIGLKDIKSELRFFHGKDILDFELPDEGINVEDLEKDLLKKAMQKANGVATKAAKLLGMSYKTFWYRWEKLNIDSPKKDTFPK